MSEERIARLEERIKDLETRLQDEINRLYGDEWKAFDDRLDAFSKRIAETHDRVISEAFKLSQETGEKVRVALNRLNALADDKLHELVTGSREEKIVKALASTILVTRAASRAELQSGANVLVVRNATQAELKS